MTKNRFLYSSQSSVASSSMLTHGMDGRKRRERRAFNAVKRDKRPWRDGIGPRTCNANGYWSNHQWIGSTCLKGKSTGNHVLLLNK